MPKTATSSKLKVFIAPVHREEDRDWLRRFAKTLQSDGARVWMVESEVGAGEPVAKAIENGMRRSDVIVVFVTADALKSGGWAWQLGAALGMKKRFVAIVPASIDVDELPLPVRARRYLIQGEPEETARELLGPVAMEKAV